MRFRTKLKIFLGVCLVVGALVCFVAFNSFGIDTNTIYSLQGDMTAFQYDRARGYKYSGNEMYGIFQNIEEEKLQEDTDGSASDDTTADNTYSGDTVYDTPTNNNNSSTSSWLDICANVHRCFGSQGCVYAYGSKRAITGLDGNNIIIRQDCSGYVGYCMYVYGKTGDQLGVNSASDFSAYGMTPVSEADLQAGDIIQYNGHVEVYAGNGRVYNWGGAASAQNKYTGVDASTVDPTSNRVSGHTFVSGWRFN